MKPDAKDQDEIRRYLLGRVPPQDLPALEERIFVDSELYEELSIVEVELIDEYLRGELAPSDRERFESHFMAAPERREKMRFARALKKFADAEGAAQAQEDSVTDKRPEAVLDLAEPPPKSRPFFSFLPFQTPIVSYALAAVILFMVVGVSWIAWKNWKKSPPPDPGKVLAVTLTSGLSRSDGETIRVSIPADTGTLRLKLLLPSNQYQFYEASLLDSNGRTLTTKNSLKPDQVDGQPAVFLDVFTDRMPPGDYRVKVNGLTDTGNAESVASYSFRVLK